MDEPTVEHIHLDKTAGANLSWSAIFGGIVSFIAVFITLSFVGSAIGFGLLEPTSNDPINGAGMGTLIWTVINFLASFGIAGFIAGVASRRAGMVHGFLTWATATVSIVLLVSYTTVSAISGLGSLLGSAVHATGQGVHAVASGAGGVGDTIADNLSGVLDDVNVDTNDWQSTLEETLKDTEQEELQPEYLQAQVEQAQEEIKEAAKQIATEPDNAKQIINDTAESLQQRAETIGEGVDRDAVAKAVSKNTDLKEDEAKKATDEIYNGYQEAVEKTQEAIDTAAQHMTELADQAEQTIADARQSAEDATGATAQASIGAFIAMLVAMIAAVVGGRLGVSFATKRK